MIRIFLMAGFFCTAVLFGGDFEVYAAETPKLVNYKIVDESSIPLSLTGKKGNSDKGRKLVINRKKGNCLACHTMPIPEQPYHGKVGPELNGVASRYEEGELRLLVVNPKIVNETTIMPAFYRNSGFNRVHKKFKGKTILSAQEVEDIVAYLTTLVSQPNYDKLSFGEAFRQAMKNPDAVAKGRFMWRGRSYATQYAKG